MWGYGKSLRESSASCASLIGPKLSLNGPKVFPKKEIPKYSKGVPSASLSEEASSMLKEILDCMVVYFIRDKDEEIDK